MNAPPKRQAYEEGRAAVVAAVESLSVQEKIDLAELELRSEIARNIIRQFVRVNLWVLSIVAVVFLIDTLFTYLKLMEAKDRIVDSKVVMAIIGATTVQFGAIAFAVSQWLFPKK
jgi:hypothetical protein